MMRALLTAALAAALTGCGVGGVLAGSAGGGGGGGSTRPKPPRPEIDVTLPRGQVGSNLVEFEISFEDKRVDLTDPDASDPLVRVVAEFDVGQGMRPMTEAEIAASGGTRALRLSEKHRFVWNTLPDLGGFRGDVTFRFTAVYEEIEGLARDFLPAFGSFTLDNRLAGTVLGAETRADSDVDTFPVDLRVDGTGVLIACTGANIVERLGPNGRTDRVTGIGVAGEIVGFGQAPGVARLPSVAGVDADALGNVFVVHDRSITVTTRAAAYTFGLTGTGDGGSPNTRVVPPRTVATVIGGVRTSLSTVRQFGPVLTSARGLRLHPSGAVVLLSDGTTLFAANPQDPADAGSAAITLGGVEIPPGQVAAIAGGGSRTDDGAPALEARFTDPYAVAVGPDGEIYVSEAAGSAVRVFNPGTAAVAVGGALVAPGAVHRVAGTSTAGFGGDGGPANAADLQLPRGIDVSPERVLFIADSANRRIRAANLGTSPVTFAETVIAPGAMDTVVGGGESLVGSRARETRLEVPLAVAIDAQGNLLAADAHRVVFVNGGTTTAHSYGATAGAARVAQVYDSTDRGGVLLVEPRAMQALSSEVVYFADRASVRVMNLGSSPRVFGGALARPGNSAIVGGGSVAGFFGDGGAALGAAFSNPSALAAEGPFVLYVADTDNDRIRALNTDDARLGSGGAHAVHGVLVPPGNVVTVVGGGPTVLPADGDGLPATAANLSAPQGVAVSNAGLLFISDTGHHRIRVVNPGPDPVTVAGVLIAPGTIRTILGDGVAGFTADGPGPWRLDTPTALALDRDLCYFADSGNARIRVLNLSAEVVNVADIDVPPLEVRTICGNGVRGNDGDFGLGVEASIDTPRAFALQTLDNERAVLYFSDGPQHVVRMLNLTSDRDLVGSLTQSGGVAITVPDASIVTLAGGPNDPDFRNAPAFAGDGGEASGMRFAEPWGIAVTTFGGVPAHLFVADSRNQRIRRFGAPPLVR